MAGEIVSNGLSNNEVTHSVNRAAAFLLNRPVHRCEFLVEITTPALSFNSHDLAFTGSQWDTAPAAFMNITFGSMLWGVTNYIDASWLYRGTITYGGAIANPPTERDSESETWAAYLGLYPHIGAAPFEWVFAVDMFRDPPTPPPSTRPNYGFVTAHAAWKAPWRKAFQSTAATSNAGTLSLTPLTLAETVDFYQNLIPVQALRVAQADFGDHIYCAGSAFTAPVTIANPWP